MVSFYCWKEKYNYRKEKMAKCKSQYKNVGFGQYKNVGFKITRGFLFR